MNSTWKQRPEGGNKFAMWLLRGIACHGGRGVARLLLVPITAYFMLVRGPERRASQAYLGRVLGRPVRWRDTARHIHTFASVILDRVFLLSGRMEQFRVDVTGLEDLHAQMDKGRGVLIFGSHLGSFDALRVLAQERPDVQVKVVLDKAQAPAMTELLGALNPRLADCIIDASMDSTSIVMAIKQATDEGNLVALLVDRTRPEDPYLPAQFLGAQAQFPTSPWLIAAVLKVPVVLAFGLYHGKAHYSLAFETYSDGLEVSRRNRAACLGALIRGYAERLEHYARRAPYNWFNFYDFWNAKHVEGNIHADLGADADAAVQRRTAVRRIA
ncbi:Predicted acyltransferase, LPLAT superfamily [Pseudoxanthomonas sp. GM95]|uniref:LpxL/LpxP family acyltransferase n=1 Tax=Pseudoxanthomonas sp. GM95 TaxID=1881043 RepID=UPI0008C64808|nr:acyltransferase [Pseudoxanthomonas sp. GM95]SEM39654.1 Predicted acyltransferase, LPLAT superfamily [Pseudoxanthomonas sp. GM95]